MERDTGLLLSARKYHKQIHSDTKTEYVQTVYEEQHNWSLCVSQYK